MRVMGGILAAALAAVLGLAGPATAARERQQLGFAAGGSIAWTSSLKAHGSVDTQGRAGQHGAQRQQLRPRARYSGELPAERASCQRGLSEGQQRAALGTASSRELGAPQVPRRGAAALLLLALSLPLQASAASWWNPLGNADDDDGGEGSELAPVVKDGKPSPVLLVPVLDAALALENIAALVVADKVSEALVIASGKPFSPSRNLKRVLNAYSDNIYTSDQNRKNMYLDGSAMLGLGKSTVGFGSMSVGSGGASPESGETLTYLYRNEIIDNCDALAAELRYLLAQKEKQGKGASQGGGGQEGGDAESREDLLKYLAAARGAFASYLASLPQGDVAAARSYVDMRAAK